MNIALDDNRIAIIEMDNLDQAQHGYGAFYIKDSNLVFCTGDGINIEVPSGKRLVRAQEHFNRKILREAMSGLDAHLQERINDREMYSTEQFWHDALKHAGRTIVPNALWIDYRGIPYGYLIFHTGDCGKSLCYSFVDSVIVPQGDGGKFAATAVELCYHGLLDQMLAQRHDGTGTAHEAYTAIAEINGFLKNKRTVHAIWPDGTARQSYERSTLTAADLFCIRQGRFEANTSGYRETPRVCEGLPVGLRHKSGEYRLIGMALERLELSVPEHGTSKSQGQNILIDKISGMIPSGTWFPFCKIKLTMAQGNTDTFLHPSNPLTRDDLMKLDAVKAFLRRHRKKNGLKATVVNYCIGTGGPGDMPAEVFSLLEQLGYWQWQQIPGFGEGSPRTIEFDTEFLKDFLNDNIYEDTPADRDATNLMPPSVKRKLKANKLYSKDGQGKKAEVVVKYFNPSGVGTWLITEGNEEKNGDWLLFGMCHIFEWEWGYVNLSELQSIKAPPFGLGIERDLYSSGTVEELMGG